jgi:hypothetical protein
VAAAPWGNLYAVGASELRRLVETGQPGSNCMEPPFMRLSRLRVAVPPGSHGALRLYVNASQPGRLVLELWRRLRSGKLRFHAHRLQQLHPGRNRVVLGRRTDFRPATYVINAQLIGVRQFASPVKRLGFRVTPPSRPG